MEDAKLVRIGKRTMRVECPCGLSHEITADDEGKMSMETFEVRERNKNNAPKKDNKGKKSATTFFDPVEKDGNEGDED